MKNRVILFVLLLAFLTSACGAAAAETREKVLSQMIGNWLANWHYSGKKIDDDFSAKGFAQYEKYLDNGKSFLIQADLDALKAYELQGRRRNADGDFSLPRLGSQLLRQRVLQVQGHLPGNLEQAVRLQPRRADRTRRRQEEISRDLAHLREWWQSG